MTPDNRVKVYLAGGNSHQPLGFPAKFGAMSNSAYAAILKIATAQKRACGFRSSDHFKIAIYFPAADLICIRRMPLMRKSDEP